jgi:hypothetical protein
MKHDAHSECDHCHAAKRDEWRVRGAALRMQMRRHDLTFRELMIAELVLDKTYGWQRDSVVIPLLRYFTDFTGIGQPDVVKVLRTLHARRVIRIQTIKGLPNYSINPDSESWKAMPRVSASTMQATLNLLREVNGLEPIHVEQEAELNFKDRRPAKNITSKIGDLPMSEPTGEQTEEFPNFLN